MRLIDADKVSAEIEKFLYPAPNFDAAYYNDGINDALSEIEDTETVDAVPVIRCKDCSHGHHLEGAFCCFLTKYAFAGDDFCSYGEKKEGDG